MITPFRHPWMDEIEDRLVSAMCQQLEREILYGDPRDVRIGLAPRIQPMGDQTRSVAAECIGITEAEIRFCSRHPYMDRYVVTEWNGRVHDVAAFDMFIAWQRRPASRLWR